MSGHPVHGAILRAGLHAANVILLPLPNRNRARAPARIHSLRQIDHEHEQEHDYEKEFVILARLATFPARERDAFANLLTWPAIADLISE
jgi:hypothetical protein